MNNNSFGAYKSSADYENYDHEHVAHQIITYNNTDDEENNLSILGYNEYYPDEENGDY
ncbi:hypothetical protein KGV55_01075 [Candidatus Gracilibacteria bacterium]|nr:hypothetical protein [Candidatus Gracilibacteria bacterium]